MTERLPPPNPAMFPPLRAEYVRVLSRDHVLGRIHFTSGAHPSAWNTFRFFGPTRRNRFDHQPPPCGEHAIRAILYAAPVVKDSSGHIVVPLDTCLAEVFREAGVVDTKTGSPYFALFKVVREVRLLDVTDTDWITVAGGNAAISSGLRRRAQEWARAIYRHYGDDRLDGLLYGSSNMPRGRSVALFETARDALPPHPTLDYPLGHPGLWADVEIACEKLGLVLPA